MNRASCHSCGCSLLLRADAIDAIDAWNTRATPAQPAGMREALAMFVADWHLTIPEEKAMLRANTKAICAPIADAILALAAERPDRAKLAGMLEVLERDARRYRRLQILGCAPGYSPQLADGSVLRFTGLDAYVDADISAHPSRGEAALPAERPAVAQASPQPEAIADALGLIKEAKELLALAYKATGYKSKINSAVWRLTYAERALAPPSTESK